MPTPRPGYSISSPQLHLHDLKKITQQQIIGFHIFIECSHFYSLCWVTINHKPKFCSSILHLLLKDIERVDKHYLFTACIYVWTHLFNWHQVWHRLIYTTRKGLKKGLQQNNLFLSCCYHYNKNISSDMIGLAQYEHTPRTYRKTKIHVEEREPWF